MTRKKSDGLTPRQRQSQRIMREKAARKKRRHIMHKLQWMAGSIAAIVILGGGLWGWKSGFIARSVEQVADGGYQLTAKAGFSVQSLYLEGRNRTSMAEIEKAMGVKRGDPILRLSLPELQERLEHIESIRFAAVDRELPNTLYIRVVEREPVALWQHKGKVALVDDNGVVMTGIDAKPYAQLPLIVGDEAPKHVSELMAILAAEPELAKRFAAGIYVGERRWNIRLNNNIEVKLPEKDPASAWKNLAQMQADQQLLDRGIKVIDLRIEGRLFIKLTPQDTPAKPVNAKET